MSGNFKLTHLGSQTGAEATAVRAERNVSAYAKFLAAHTFEREKGFAARPFVDKKSYLTAYNFAELLGDDFDRTFTIFKSSGSSGQAFYWPQLKDAHRSSSDSLRRLLEGSFAIHQRRTLAIVGLALGSWIGGEHFSWVLKSMAVESPYPFSVFSPGSCHDEIIEMARRASPFVDQIILFVCPSAIAHLILRAEQTQRPLPLAKMRYIVIGEPFPESVRLSLQRKSGVAGAEPVLLSVYGSADTGALGFESPASIALRQILNENRQLATDLGASGPVPHFFHCCAPDAFIESVNGELCITRWQGIPLVRYNLHDSVLLYAWPALRQRLLAESCDPILKSVIEAAPELPDLIAIPGRSDNCLILCGSNISETMLDAAVRSEELSAWLTGMYKARVILDDERQYLELALEFKSGAAANRENIDAVYRALVQTLGREQPEFLDDWRNVYCKWDDDPPRRILRLHCVAWPELSRGTEKEIKQRGIRT